MSLCASDQNKEKLMLRLKKIEGQIRGINSMVEKDKDCMDVLNQVNSAIGALRGVWNKVLEDHLKGCIAKAALNHDERMVDELVEHLKKIR